MFKRYGMFAATAALTLMQTAAFVAVVGTPSYAADNCTENGGGTGGSCTAQSLALSANVQESCSTFSAASTTQTLPVYDVYANASTADAGTQVTYTVKCTKGSTTPAFWVDGGNNASGANRRLGDGSGDFLTYNLCDTNACANTLAIGSSTSTISLTGSSTFVSQNSPNGNSGLPLKFGFYPVISSGQDVPVGSYNDSINVNVNW